MSRSPRDYLVEVADDGLPAPEVGAWAEEKYRRVGMYAEMFATGMKNTWPTRVYVDLFAGSGHAIIRESGKRVLTSPMLALRAPDPFSRYILCERDESYAATLRVRASRSALAESCVVLNRDVNESTDEIGRLIPPYRRGNRVLTFCFVDPFGLDIHFETIRRFGEARAMDFLILLALGMDANRNWANYRRSENHKVDLFLGGDSWRNRWPSAERNGDSPILFLAREYAHAMNDIGYLTRDTSEMIEVKTYTNNMRLYYLAFFSKHPKGYEFWKHVRAYSTDQFDLGLSKES